MKKNSIFAAIALLCLLVSSCSDTLNEPVLETKNDIEYHGVPVEDALEYLNAFLATNDESTRSNGTRRIGSVNVVRNKDLATRSSNTAIANADSLIYVVNFEDNQGFAYLAADDRISTPIIFVADSGNVSTYGLGFNWGEPIATEVRDIYAGYPITGPGTFYAYNDSTGQEELYMNPNTFSLLDSETDSYYVGNFYFNEEEDPIQIINDYTFNFVEFEINENGGSISDVATLPLEGDPNENVTVETTKRTTYSSHNHNFLDFAKNWSQSQSPYNDLFPTVYQFLSLEHIKGYTGCVPLALAKIMTHHAHPEVLTCYGKQINWYYLRNYPTLSGRISASYLLKYIADQCGSLIFYDGTFTFPSLAAILMSTKGYKNVQYIDYNTQLAKIMIDNECPILVCSVPIEKDTYNLRKSHAWNIDGYKIRTTHIEKKYYRNNICFETTHSSTETLMVHCDWGWKGMCNGYFESGVFNLAGSEMLWDNNIPKAKNTNFNWYLKMIKYDKPY